jgi:hypothetical protein
MLQLAQRLRLDLADPFADHRELLADTAHATVILPLEVMGFGVRDPTKRLDIKEKPGLFGARLFF